MTDFTGQSTNPSLLRAIAEGQSDSRSWPIFVEKYGPILFRWCQRWGANPQDSEDIVQECLIVVYRKLDTYRKDPRSNFRSWLKTVAYRIWLQVMDVRERKIRETDQTRPIFLEEWEGLRSQAAREDLSRSLDAIADREILELASNRVRDRVEPMTWNCFELSSLQGMSGKEVAERLDINIAAVFTNACRVRKLLKQEVEQLEAD